MVNGPFYLCVLCPSVRECFQLQLSDSLPNKRTPNTGSSVGPVRNNLGHAEREIRGVQRDSLQAAVQRPRDLRGKDIESGGVKSGKSRGWRRGTKGVDIKGKNRNT